MDPAVSGGDRLLGFAGMVAAGKDPAEAWNEIHRSCQDSAAAAIFADLNETEEGRAALDYSRRLWADRGFPPPWAPDAEVL